MSSILATCQSIALRAVTLGVVSLSVSLSLPVLVGSSALIAEEPRTEALSYGVSPAAVQTLMSSEGISSESKAASKRDLQAAVASLRQTPQPEPEVSPWPLAKGLVLCLAVFCVIIFLLKKLNPHAIHSGKRRMAVLERLPLSPKSSLVLIQVEGRTRVIAVGSEQVQMLDGWEKLRSPAREFSEVLAAVPGAPVELSAPGHEKGVA